MGRKQQTLNVAHWFGLGLGLGFFPASGTCGSLLGLVIGLGVQCWHGGTAAILTTGIAVWCWWCCIQAYDLCKNCDHKAIVADEIAGMVLAMWGLPVTIETVLWVFILFRVFDISKIGPIGWVERLPLGAHAVLLDDLVAGLCANMFMRGYLLLHAM